jgi:hypothetical protein
MELEGGGEGDRRASRYTEETGPAAKILSHLGSWDRKFSHPTFFEVGGIEHFPSHFFRGRWDRFPLGFHDVQFLRI